MFALDDVEPESFDGEIGVLLKEILRIPTATSQKIALIKTLKEAGSNSGYVMFKGFSHNYHLSKVGYSYIYDVPENKRGHLSPFRGERVRVICVGSGKNWVRWYMAGIIK